MTGQRLARLGLLGAACLMALAAGPMPTPMPPRHAHPERLALRLVDLGLGPGYVVGNVGFGSVLAGEGATPALTRVYLDHPHVGGSAEFLQTWAPDGSPPRPNRITSAAFSFRDTAGPVAELRLSGQVAANIAGGSPAEITPAPATTTIGQQTVVFHTPNRPGGSTTVILWRSDRVLAGIVVEGLPAAAGEHEALRLAAVQQARIDHPTPLGRHDNDDVEVPLDNPHLGIDVHWIGRRFDPGGRLPQLRLTSANGPLRRGEGPGEVVSLEYGRRPFGGEVHLGVWRRRAWVRNARTRFGRLIWHERCTRSERVPVSGGYARVYAGYETRRPQCDDSPPDRILAHVFLGDTVVTVNDALCLSCREGGGPYDSRAGMLAVVRGLRERTPKIVRSP